MRQRSINAQLREKILALDSTGLRIEFFRPDEGMRVYHLGRGIIMDLAEEAGALYKVGMNLRKSLKGMLISTITIVPAMPLAMIRQLIIVNVTIRENW